MAKEKDLSEKKRWRGSGGSPSGAVYGLGFVGALIYFLQHSPTFWAGVIGVLKALVWPALLIYKVFTLLKI